MAIRNSCFARVHLFVLLFGLGGAEVVFGVDGKALYQTHCASCHGEQGQGVPGARELPLYGDRSMDELSDYIDRAMPEGEPEKCNAEESRAIAEFMYGTFYTEIARVRNQPPRPSLLRLTNRQYRESVADIISTFRGRGNWSQERGLTGAYRDGKWQGNTNRVDAKIDLHFGNSIPEGTQTDKEEYVIQWQGGIRSLEFGDYEFIVRSTNGFRLWVNNMDVPLIDAAVKSGDMAEHSASLKLLADRPVPVRLELKRVKGEEGNITLEWRPPNRTRQVIPSANLSPGWFPEVAVVTTPFPPDDSSFGYERGLSISREWEEASIQAALEVADFVVANLNQLANTKDDDEQKVEKVKAFCKRFTQVVHRGRLNDEEAQGLVDRYWQEEVPESTRVKKIVVRGLWSPAFIYQPAASDRSPQAIASRLALSLWDSLPDPQLMEAAYHGGLSTPEGIRQQAERMVRDERAVSKMRYFFGRWMQLDRGVDISKDKSVYSDFNDQLVSDLRESLDRFVDDLLRQENDDYRQLFLADYLFVNQSLAKYYDLPWTEGSEWQKVSIDPQVRAGILTHPFLLSSFAYQRTSSPIHRGVFLARKVLGRHLPNPPIAVSALDESIDPQLTTRERVILQTKPEDCQVCHTMINELGFSLENYDAVGRFRLQEREKPINATGSYRATSGEEKQFSGPRELAVLLSQHADAHEALVEQLFHHNNQQPIYAYGENRLAEQTQKFRENQFSIRKAFVESSVLAAEGIGQQTQDVKVD